MSNVSLSIGGRDYAVACAPGEEAHVAGLGRMIDAKLAGMAGGQPMGETRGLLFAALLLADQVHELEAGRNGAAQDGGADSAGADSAALERLAALAERIEALAGKLEAGVEKRRRRA